MKTTAIAYWLVPAEPANELFREIIGILAKQLDAPRFQPHMTICAALRNGRSAGVVLRQISLGPIRLRVRGVRYANRFSKTLFVRFQGNRALDELNASLRRAAELSAGVLRDPHVSLLYKRMPTAAKKQLVSTIRLPMQEVVFDSLKAVRCITPTESRSDVEAWRVVATKKLRD